MPCRSSIRRCCSLVDILGEITRLPVECQGEQALGSGAVYFARAVLFAVILSLGVSSGLPKTEIKTPGSGGMAIPIGRKPTVGTEAGCELHFNPESFPSSAWHSALPNLSCAGGQLMRMPVSKGGRIYVYEYARPVENPGITLADSGGITAAILANFSASLSWRARACDSGSTQASATLRPLYADKSLPISRCWSSESDLGCISANNLVFSSCNWAVSSPNSATSRSLLFRRSSPMPRNSLFISASFMPAHNSPDTPRNMKVEANSASTKLAVDGRSGACITPRDQSCISSLCSRTTRTTSATRPSTTRPVQTSNKFSQQDDEFAKAFKEPSEAEISFSKAEIASERLEGIWTKSAKVMVIVLILAAIAKIVIAILALRGKCGLQAGPIDPLPRLGGILAPIHRFIARFIFFISGGETPHNQAGRQNQAWIFL